MVAVFLSFKLVDVTYLNEPCFVAEGYRGSFILKETFTTNQWTLPLSFPNFKVLVRLVEDRISSFTWARGSVLRLGRRPHRFAC
jgi:hypothetical protein